MLCGYMYLHTGRLVEAAIADALDANPSAEVCSDLSGVTCLDSSGIAALLRGRRAADGRRTVYRVAGAHGITLQVLELTGVWVYLSGEPEPDPSTDPAS